MKTKKREREYDIQIWKGSEKENECKIHTTNERREDVESERERQRM